MGRHMQPLVCVGVERLHWLLRKRGVATDRLLLRLLLVVRLLLAM